jgi:hypothetical protein
MNEDTIDTTQHMMMLEVNHDRFPKGNIKLHDNKKVHEKVELYDLK